MAECRGSEKMGRLLFPMHSALLRFGCAFVVAVDRPLAQARVRSWISHARSGSKH